MLLLDPKVPEPIFTLYVNALVPPVIETVIEAFGEVVQSNVLEIVALP